MKNSTINSIFNSVDNLEVLKILSELNRKLDDLNLVGLRNIWLPKKDVMRFFDYGETQIRQLEKEQRLITSKIKARKFYSVESILNVIEQHKTQ